MSESPDRRASGAAKRVARNTGVRAAAELVSKFASLALLAVLAREEGPAQLGVLVFALAWCELAITPVDMGFDRWFLRLVARDRANLDRCFFNVLSLKLVRALAVIPLSLLAAWALGREGDAFLVICLITLFYLFDTFTFTVVAALNGVERGDLVGAALATQRLTAAALGVTAVLAGHGVVGAAAAYAAGAATGFAAGLALLARHTGLPARALPRDARDDLRRRSRPFAAQELLSIGLARVDVMFLAALASSAVVGYYGAAYRLLEATLFVSTALQGAFAAMYTYLDERSEPTINAVFQRSLKLSLIALVPCAVALGVLPGPILELVFGDGFADAEPIARALGPVVVLLGLVLLSVSLISSRLDPRRLVGYFAVALAVNLAANAALIPALEGLGAAIAMLLAEVVLAVLTLRACVQAVGALRVAPTCGAPLAGGAAMAAVLAGLAATPLLAFAAGAVVYVAVLVAVERRLAPDDLGVVVGAARRRLPPRIAARI